MTKLESIVLAALALSFAVPAAVSRANAETRCDEYVYSACNPISGADDCDGGWRIELATINISGHSCDGLKDGATRFSPDGRIKYVYGNVRRIPQDAKVSSETTGAKRVPAATAPDQARSTAAPATARHAD